MIPLVYFPLKAYHTYCDFFTKVISLQTCKVYLWIKDPENKGEICECLLDGQFQTKQIYIERDAFGKFIPIANKG